MLRPGLPVAACWAGVYPAPPGQGKHRAIEANGSSLTQTAAWSLLGVSCTCCSSAQREDRQSRQAAAAGGRAEPVAEDITKASLWWSERRSPAKCYAHLGQAAAAV